VRSFRQSFRAVLDHSPLASGRVRLDPIAMGAVCRHSSGAENVTVAMITSLIGVQLRHIFERI
jgi:hypothetical protein